ncbi:MAG: hypothetical protein ACI9UO_003091, partial [Nitrospinales bacterium]
KYFRNDFHKLLVKKVEQLIKLKTTFEILKHCKNIFRRVKLTHNNYCTFF